LEQIGGYVIIKLYRIQIFMEIEKTIEEDMVIEMDQSLSSKIFLVVFFLAIILSLSASYWRIVMARDYNIIAGVDCDPYTEMCFVHVCNPDPMVDGECTGDPEEDTWYTKNLNRKAYNIPECSPDQEDCKALVCEDGEEGCFYEMCLETNVPEGDTCNDPEQYTKDNPIEEEEMVECEEGDDECVSEEEETECEEGDTECVATESESEKDETSACDEKDGVACPVEEEE
jgi:hypothetical protein